MEEQAEASDRLANVEKLQASVSELRDCCVRLETEKGELQTEIDKLRTSLSFADETLTTKHEEIEQLTIEVQQVCRCTNVVNSWQYSCVIIIIIIIIIINNVLI